MDLNILIIKNKRLLIKFNIYKKNFIRRKENEFFKFILILKFVYFVYFYLIYKLFIFNGDIIILFFL